MSADRLDTAGEQFGPEFFRGQIVSTGQFGVLDAVAFDLIEGCGHVLLELLAQAIELKSEWAREAGLGIALGRSATTTPDGNGKETKAEHNLWFHRQELP